MAHNEPELLKLLVSRLAEDFDVYLHLDKAFDVSLESLGLNSGRVQLVPRQRVPWGSPAVLKTELLLLEEASRRGYERYVLISGQCVPLRSNAEIRKTLRANLESEWLDSNLLTLPEDEGFLQRLQRVYWHAPWRYRGLQKFLYLFVEYFLEIMYRTVVRKKPLKGDFYMGEAWFALSHRAVLASLDFASREDDFMKSFSAARAGEELYFNTVVRRVFPPETKFLGTATYTDWRTGPEIPRTLDESDLSALVGSRFLFARKVSWQKSRSLVQRLYSDTATGAVE
jgi:hypothetical protein